MHGHSYSVEVAVEGTLQTDGPATGMVEDFDVVAREVRSAVIDPLDHRSLNDVMANPTAERIALWIWPRLAATLPGLTEIVLWETSTACVVLRKDHPDIKG